MNNRVACVRKTLHLTRSAAPVIPTCYLWSRLVKVRYTAAEWAATPPVLPKGLVSSLRGANNGDTILSHPGGGVPPLWILLLFLGPRSRPRLCTAARSLRRGWRGRADDRERPNAEAFSRSMRIASPSPHSGRRKTQERAARPCDAALWADTDSIRCLLCRPRPLLKP